MAVSSKLRAWRQDAVQRLLAAIQRLRLPGPSVLPVAGAVVGVYSGLAAGLFANLIALVRGLSFGFPLLLNALRPGSETRQQLAEALTGARWHFEFIIVGVPLGLAASRAGDPTILEGFTEVLYYGFYDLTGLQLDFFEAVTARCDSRVGAIRGRKRNWEFRVSRGWI